MADIDIAMLLSELTLDEKISLIAGKSTWRTAAVERLGIPDLKFTDGPSGARGEIFGEGVPAAFLPCGVSLGATWDTDLIFQLGELLAEETRSKSASVLLSPTTCIQRHPLGGRNFESFSEDPYLSGKLATALVRGLQTQGIGATPKHFVANDQETRRFHVNATIPERALREVYLLPFQMVVRDSDPWCMMTAYNKVNGQHCDMSKELLTDIVRDEWAWNGLFVSDWGGTNSSAMSVNAGLDLEMPGPPSKRAQDQMRALIQKGEVDLHRIDESAGRVLDLLVKANRFKNPIEQPEVCLNKPEHNKLLRQAASAGIVLLKNEDNALPLSPDERVRSLAILGPNSERVVAGGGGSSYIKAPYWTSVYESLEARFKNTTTRINQHSGARVNRYLPTPPRAVVKNPDDGINGAALDWFNGHDLNSEVMATTHVDDLYYMNFGNTPSEITNETNFSFRLQTTLTPATTGRHKLSLASIGRSNLYIDEEHVATISGDFEDKASLFFTYGSGETVFERNLVAGQAYSIRIDCYSHDRQTRRDLEGLMDPMEDKFQGVRLGYEEHNDIDLPLQAAEIAGTCDAAVIVVGRDKEWETEGEDIPCFELPGEQVRLIEEVAAVCKRTIVVIQAGTPVQMEPWIHDVQAVLYSWYQGQELGNAAADVITGLYNPSGRLPTTFPRRIEDCPAFSSFPAENDEIVYSEGLYVGYKWWDLLNIEPLFPIGFGLSYSRFEISHSSVSPHSLLKGGTIAAKTTVSNTGGSALPGQHTVIAWCSQKSKRRLMRPKKQICGFSKTPGLLPGQSCEVNLDIDAYALGMYDEKRRTWLIDANTQFEILLGSNAKDAVVIGTVEVPELISWVHRI